MPFTRKPSPARSQGAPTMPRRNKSWGNRSVGSPARSTGSERLSNIVDQFKENSKDSFAVSPLQNKAVLSDNTEIDMPRRRSWWRKVENSRDVTEVLENEQMDAGNVLEELDVEVLSQESKKNYTLDLPESSGSETINSIIVPQRKIFVEKENHPQKIVGEFVGPAHNKTTDENIVKAGTSKKLFDQAQERAGLRKRSKPFFPSELLATPDKTLIGAKKLVKAGTSKKLFDQTQERAGLTKRSKPFFPSELLATPDKTLIGAKKLAPEIKVQPKALFGNRPTRKNVFADFIVSESEDEIPEIQAKIFTFPKKSEPPRRSSVTSSRGFRESSPASSSVTTDMEIDDWKLLPSSTMVEHQLESNLTPGKKARLSKLSEAKESTNTDSTNINQTMTKQHSKSKKGQPNTTEKEKTNSIVSKLALEEDDKEITLTYDDNDPGELQEHADQVKIPIDDRTKTICVKDRLTSTDINQTMTKQHSEYEIGEVQPNIMEKEKTNLESKLAPEEDNKKMALTSDNNDPVELQEHSDQVKIPIDDRTKTICVEDRLSKVSEYIDNIEIELSKVVGEEEQNVIEMATSMPNKSVHLTSRVVQETPDSEIEDRNTNAIAEDTLRKEVEVYQIQAQVEEKNHSAKEKKSDISSNQEKILAKQTIGSIQGAAKSVESIDKGSEASNDDEIEVTEHDNAEAVQVNEANDQEGTDTEQELDDDDDDEKDQSMNEDNENQEEVEIEGENDEQMQEDEEEDVDNEATEASEEELDDEIEIQDENVETESNDDSESIGHENEQNESQDESEVENDNQEGEEMEASDSDVEDNNEEDEEIDAIDNAQESQEEDQIEEQHETEQQQSEIKTDTNVTHDTTGRNRMNMTNTPEIAAMQDLTSENDSFTRKGLNTSKIETKSLILNKVSLRQSLASARESTGLSDGTKNSSAEGSGWDSHRTTRKTLRQTFGKDFTPRKSLRALVMEKSAKRQTAINEANAQLELHQVNSTELSNNHVEQDDLEDNVEVSDHEISQETKQRMIDAHIQKVREKNREFMRKIEEHCRNALKPNAPRSAILMNYRASNSAAIRRAAPKPVKAAAKPKRVKPSLIPLEHLPAEFLEDMKYKPPKRFKPNNASWITKRLYKFLETKLEPKYDYKARIRAEKLVETIYNFVREIKKFKLAPAHSVAELSREMARLDIVHTYFEFYDFFNEYMPYEVKYRVVPDIINDLPMPPRGIFSSILE